VTFSIVRITDANMAVVAAREYDAFGYIRSETGDWTISDLGFHSDWVMLGDSGGTLYFTPGGRVYDTTLGRFLQRDRLSRETSQNPYVALNNCPTNFVDPLGLDAVSLGACELYDIAWASYPVLPSRYAKYERMISPELLMCQFFLESSFNSTSHTHWAYGLGGMSPGGASDVDTFVYGRPVGQTWHEITSGDPSSQVAATIAYLARLLDWKKGDLREALKQYGPRDVGYAYPDILLDCEKCLKDSLALQECAYLLKKKGKNEECPRPHNVWACLGQMTSRIAGLHAWEAKNKVTGAQGKGKLWGYKLLYPNGFEEPEPFVEPLTTK
jgi:RHS repeat-associated protein